MRRWFQRAAERVSVAVGSMWAFCIAVGVVLVWAITGPIFGFSDTWQLVINTGTTIVTFLMAFLIQYTQNRDNRALHLKLDELLRADPEAHEDELIDLEHMSDEVIERAYAALCARRGTQPAS